MTQPILSGLSPAKRALREARLRGRYQEAPIVPRAQAGDAPLSHAQERLWFVDRMFPGGTVYTLVAALRLPGALDEAVLERALAEVVRRHDVLRTTFREVNGVPVQVVAPFTGFALPAEDLSALPAAAREAEVRARAARERAHVFDLSAGPLFRASLLRLAADDHVLLLGMHHAVCDAWSMGVFQRELSVLYAAYREGWDSPLAPLAVQYADYAAWQRSQPAAVEERHLAYWRRQLGGAPELLELPTDRPRTPVPSFRGAQVPLEAPLEVLDRLRALANAQGATLHMVLLAAYQVLLARYAATPDVSVGIAVSGRSRREVEGLIGIFVNNLVLRTDLSGDPTFRAVVDRVREMALDAYQHQEVPFERVVAELRPQRSLSHAALFQVLFLLDEIPPAPGGGGGGGLRLEPLAGQQPESTQVDLTLNLRAHARGLSGSLEYATDLFDEATARRMARHLERMLALLADEPDARIGQVTLLDEAERRQAVEAWNATGRAYPTDGQRVHDLFRAQAARTPHAAALSRRGERVTYAELEARANQLANALRRRGVGPETRVGICLERGPELVAAMLAILKAGGAYVPLDPAYPRERLGYMLEDAGIALVITDAALADRLPESAAGVLLLDVERDAIAAESADAPESGAVPENLSHVIFTSGSTGRPKGVMIRHASVVVLLHWLRETVTDEERASVLFSTSINFDVSVAEVFGTLCWGGTLVIAENALELATLGEEVVYASMVPSAAAELLRSGGIPASVKTLNLGGEALPNALAQGLYALGTVEKVGNLYGPTEDTTYSTYYVVPRGADEVLIGTPVANTQAYVLDAHLQPVPMGVVGELYLAGDGLSRGYANRPAMTAERFVPCPFGAPGARMYRVMDRVRRRADGELEYLGRTDFQVKVRGYRIELGEIEAVLRQAPGVGDCAVVAREDVPGDRRLVAYVVGDAEAGALRDRLRQSLPEYMVPSAFVFLDALPLTSNGKLDRQALPAPEGDAYARGSYEAPLGEVEAALAEIWAEVLGLERVGRRDHFFELGGHSLLAIRLIERMRRAGLYMEVRALFATPVLAELALEVGGASLEVEVPANGIPEGCGSITPEMLPLVELTQAEIDRIVAEVPGGAANVQDIYPLAPLQEGIHFHHLLSREGDPYLLSTVTEFDSRARLEQFLAALQAVIDRHDVLRTAMAWEGLREPVQVVWRHATLPLEEVELDADAEDAAGQLWRRFDPRRYRMELGRAPLLRACIAEDRARGRWLLLMLTHHLASDHESLEVLVEEITAHLRGAESELPAPLPFRNYVARARLGVSREEHERFFRGLLEDVEEPTAPFGLLDVWGEGGGIGEARLAVSGDVAARLRRRARALGVSAASLCHLAWAQVLARASGRSDVVFGTLLFGRMQGGEGADRAMGPFINTLPVRIGVGDAGVEAAVRRTHALLGDLLRHEHASLALAQRCSGVAAPAPLFTSLLNYRYGGGTARSQQAGQPTKGVRGLRAQERTNYPVTLSVDELGEEFSLSAQVAAPVEAERVCRMMHTALERLVDALEVSPGRALWSIDVLPEAERRVVVEAWNRTDAEYPAGAYIHELFEAQAARAPGAEAVRFEEESLTYRELNASANRLANHLRRRGVGPETRVGICLPRTAELVAAMLGVLKAGGAYVPLDPAYPRERLGYMLEDAGVALVITDSALADRLPESAAGVLLLDVERDAIAGESTDAPESGAVPENLSHVIFTSGSTGRPKGVMIRHASVVVLLHWLRETVTDEERASVLFSTSINFDVSVAEVFGTLCWGGKLVIAENALELATLGEEVVYASMVPSAAAELLKSGGIPASVKTLNLGGEALPNALAQGLYALGTVEKVGNLYGPTEDTTYSTYYVVPRGADEVLIGTPVANTQAYVLDAHLQPVPIGVVGELYLAGDGLSRGYANRPGMTAERFVPCPFGAPGARMYRVMDRVRRRTDGQIEYLGRTDFQVKVRGFRIELGEIEAVLRQAPGVGACAVVVREDVPGDRRLVAYVVGGVETDALRAHLRQSLPEYMVPAAFVPLDALPLTPNGKLDRKALPAPEYAAGADRYVAPRTPVEEVLAGIWAEVLRLERVGVEESFFELGGHSLLATGMVSRIRDVFAIELPLRALFEWPTVAKLAGRVEEMRRAELPVLPPVVPVDRDRLLPLSFSQERLWFIDRLEPGSATYNIPAALRLTGALDERALERALGEIVRRHEALRTVFREVDGSPVQVVAPFGAFALPVEDLSGLGEADREAAVRRRAGEEAMLPFALSAGPLFRAALLRLGEEDHVLLLSMHHIVSDGWSMGVIFRELSALYEAYREGGESPLAELAVQYADYAVWQREQLEGEVLDRQLAYWRARLSGAPELLELPTDHPRPPVQTYRGATVPVELSLELLERLQALSRSEGATLYMTLLGAFQVLLGRYAGSDDVVVGSPIAGRTRGEVEGLIGFFVNTLVLRTDLGGDPSFREMLRRVREATLGAYEHQEVPFEKLVAELQPERSLSHAPLFQVLFTLEDVGDGGGALPGLKVGGVDAAMEIAKFDLSLTLFATPQGLRGGLNYSTDLFERGTVERMLGHLAQVLEQVAADADVRLSRLELLDAAERTLVLEAWNRTEAEYPRDVCVHELFEAQAARTPDAAAVSFEAERLTYAELNARANRLAHHLRALGVGPDARVAVCVERGPEMIAGLLAILKAGGAYVPLDPAYPTDRLRYMLEDSAPAALVTQSSLAGTFAGLDVPAVELDAASPAWASHPATDLGRAGLTPNSLAYVIYTSGSTGRPKGVMVEHRSLVNHTAWQAAAFGIGAGDTVLQRTSISFDASVWELWTPLSTGARMLLLSSSAVKDPDAIGRVMAEGEVTVAQFVPTLLQAVLGAHSSLPCRVLFCGGEPLPAALVEEARAAGAGEVVNLYGPTEATIDSTSQVCGLDDRAPAIGRPIANARIYVLDARGEPAPVGVAGELYVGGAGVARGYLGRAGLTAERFVPDAFGGEPGARLYRTGDLGRWRADGTLEFLGRTDFQVKIRGIRIELGEIEARLAEHPGVRECAVLAREEAGEKRVVAYVVGEVETDALRAHLRRSLPEHMVPSAFVFLNALPLTPNGKLDRKALPAPELASAAEKYVAPRTPTEEVLAGIWAEVLRLERVGVEESFFELGGHSLLATRVVSRVREVLGVEIPLRALFEAPTVAELAARIDLERRAGEGAALPPLVPVAREAPLPLSFAQERLWFLHQMEPEGAGYNMPWPGRLRGSLDAGALERALGELVRRHESLRTTFRPVEQGAVQVIHPAETAHLPVLDLTGLAPQEREHEARRLAREDAERPFDLERGPLLRVTLVRLSDEEHVLLLCMHHIVSDGWSMGVLFRELFTLYDAFSRPSDAASPLPPLAVQYADFAVWQRGWLQGKVLQRQLDWWRERLGGAPPALELPTDRPRPAVASSRGAALMFRLSADVTRGLRSLARREGATLYMVTHAALDLLLSRWSGQEDLVVGSPIAGRTQVGTEGLIGFFVNTLALRTDLSGDPTFRELLGRVRETALGAYAHQELPFERLVEEVAPERGLSHTPLFQVMFALQNVDAGQGSAIGGLRLEPNAGVRLEPFGGEIRTVRFDLELDLHEVGEELLGSLRFRTDLFDAPTMERFAAQYGIVLAAAIASPEERLSRLAIMPDEEAQTLLAYGSGPAREEAGGVPVHLLFAEQSARTPNAPAVLFAGESLTYAELDARAERLARRLRGYAEPGVPIAVCLERGPEAVVALLAIWKAGGVYLPLDPSHPAERLSFFLRDSGAKLVVSNLALAGDLLERETAIHLLDPSTEEGDVFGGELDLGAGGGPGDLAYLIYTSGSTGTPKAVMVEHAQLTHTLRGALDQLGFVPGDVVAALASTAFDISLLELVTPLLAGGSVRIIPHEVARDPETLVDAARDVSVLHAVPALMRQVVEVVRGGGILPSLRLLLVGGDSVPPDLLEDMREVFPAAETRVLYGPTEGTIICATYAVTAEGAVVGHPLGRPLPGVRLAVRGPRGELAPLGIPGELWISGGGVARGYLGRPELNAEKFVSIEGERAYRTGDRARWRPDGVLEFLGRADEQVKVRGFRIEPGEVEAVLREQPGVREAVVLAREDAPGDRRLVAYVVPGAEGVETAGGGREQVSEWETLFDDTYAQDEGEEDPELQLKGWNSSYTGEPIPREEMRAWIEHTAERILALRPERVLEIGTGTGLLLFRVGPHVSAYHGTDFSGVALEHIRRHAAELPQVALSEREADDLAEFAGAGFDTVVINSVAQYFPDLDYLLRVLEGAAAALRPGGRIFVGDVRSLPLAGAFHASVELARAPDDLPTERLLDRVRRGIAEEQELLVDPALFEALRARIARLGRVEVQVKRGEYDNEVSRFRYDVVLHLDMAAAASAPVVREWSGEDADGLRALAEGNASALLVRGVPDARVREHVRAYELVSAGGGVADAAAVRALAARGAGGIAPEALFALGEEIGRATEVRPGASGTLDVLFHPAGGIAHFPEAVDAERPWESYANDPQWGRRMRALVPALREAARARLPEYMVPSAFVVLEAFPVTPNGKVDRGALPAPDTPGSRGETYVAPRTPAEERMAGIWAEVLGVERVGAEDHFFDLGGHSLLATRVAARVREAFGVELPLRAVFERPALSELAAEIERLGGTGAADGDGAIAPATREGDLPVTFAQERLWFVDALDPGSPVYAMPSSYRITGDLDDGALRRALAELVRRHEPLRTTLPAVDGVPVQRIAPPPSEFDLPVSDLRHLPEGERRGEAGRLSAEAARHRFDLARGPLFRASLVHVADAEHLLLLNLHHAIGDGWSMGVLLEELSALYGAFSRGEASPLAEPALQYADYAVWQREHLSGAALERQVEFWRRALDGAPALLELPADRPRPPVESHRGALEQLFIASELAADVNALARREGATLFMVLLAALDVVLGRLAGQEDVVVGTPIAGRTRAETDRMVGLFLNSLALRTDLSGDPSFRELLGRVRETTLAAYAHQDLPFERVLEEVRPERSMAHAPVFQVMLNLLNFQDGDLRAEGLEVAGGGTGGEVSSKFDLTLYVGERDGRIVVDLVYAADLFDAPRMRALLSQLEGVLRQAAAAPETRVGALSLATDAARDILPAPARPIEVERWRGAVHETFAAHAAKAPQALAVSDAMETWTYAELDAAANRIAHRLIDGGVRPGDVVAVYAHRSAALVRALLGVWKAGAAFAVLDPAYPPARLAAQVGAARPAALLRLSAAGEVPAEAAAALAETARLTVVLTADGKDEGDGFSSAAPAVSVGPDDLAYVAFTSGTTGTPKAIAGTHRPLAHFFGWYARELGVGDADRVSVLSGLAHDPLLRDVFAALTVGGSIAIPDPDQVGTPGWLGGWMREMGITIAHLTPAMGQILATGTGDSTLPALRLAAFGGDVLRADDVARLRAIAPKAEAVNFYGATETPQAMGIFRLPADLATVGAAVPVGRGIDGVDLLVITPSGALAGIGELGEIAVRTPYLSRGYLNDAELTAARFVPNPLTGDPADRVYRTGDLGRYRPDGEVIPAGRVDGQVKVRGFRVELGEIEAALASHPAIREAAVVALETGAGDRRLVAYWVPADDAARAESAELRAHLKALLPEYMVPAAYVRLDRLPLTANGKLDRRALPEPAAVAADARPAAPRTPTEEILSQIWAEVLRVGSLGVDDDFFALGGHSLLATRLLARVQNALGVVLPLRAVFEGPTVAELAVRVEEMRRDGLPVLPPVVPVDRDRPLPLSFAQERLWFIDRLEGGSASYNIPIALRLRGALDVGALERGLGEIVRRHEALRTVFREMDGGAVQVIAPFAGFVLPIDDLSGLDETARETEVRRRAREDAARSFDLAEGPLVRAALLRVGDEEHVLLLCIHHIVSDGWSSGVLLRELSALYAAYREGSESPLPELPVQYADFAVWQREQLQGEVLDRQLAYWRERLADAPALLELPTDHPRPAVQTYRGARETFDLPRALLDRLQALGRSEGATLYMVMLSAFQLLLSKYSGSDDLVVGSPIAGRTRREVEELIGFFANTLVLRTDLSGDPSFRELLGRVREGTLGAYEHQEVPFERLVAELQPERSLSHAALFQVMFTLQNLDRSGAGLAGLRMEGMDGEVETTKFDLALTAVPHDGGLSGTLEYSTDLFDRSTIRRMLGHLQRVLEQVSADADVRLSRLDLLSAEERGLVVDAWNRTAAEVPADRCIHELFEAQVARTSETEAVRFEDESLTYRELNARANRLAHHLRGLGVGPEVRVGICLERSLEMVVSLLAVLKAGGAYVPLDPAYPAERLALMLADSATSVLLTQEKLRDLLVAEPGVQVVVVEEARAEIAAGSAENVASRVAPRNLAYLIYTSGSTGIPKGVAIEHESAVAMLAWAWSVYSGEELSGMLASTSLSFDMSVFELFAPLTRGGRVIVVENALALPQSAAADQVRLLDTVPSAATALLKSGGIPSAVKTVNLGGEPLRAELVDALYAHGVERVYDMYGPSEDTTFSTYALRRPGGPVTIGRVLSNSQAYVVDAGLRPVPAGVPGELYLGGSGVTRGYLGKPALTAERYVPDPFSAEPGARMYRTGDRIRWKADGTLEYLGRLDHQVKVRGFRVETGEIEAVLRRHEGVADCVVIARADAGEQRLVAYVVGEARAEALRSRVRHSLPEYMVPAAFVFLDALPLTPNGKLDRKALPAPELASAEERYVAPRTPVEEALAGIWAEVLGLERVSVEDNFFEVGGHSLLATRVVSQVRAVLGVELPLRALFETSTVAGLAPQVEKLVLARVEDQELADVLARLEGLSKDEVMELLGGD